MGYRSPSIPRFRLPRGSVAYCMTMRTPSALAWVAPAFLLVLIGCSSAPEAPKTEEKKEAVVPKKEPIPDVYKVNLDTSKGPIVLEVHRDWSPLGADHFYELVKSGFYDNNYFFRYVKGFIVQFGINGDTAVNNRWRNVTLPDDPHKPENTNARGTITYATAGARTRTTQLFINLKNNAELDKDGFTAFGKVISGMDVVDKLYAGYGDMPDMGGQGPDPAKIESQGNEYLTGRFPKLDFIKKATIQ
jgi:peptidyl-prolyl cis-trans isomerase A (cyclophilin A)